MRDANIQTPDWLLQMAAILEALNEGMVIVDHQLRVVLANAALIRLGGYDRGEMHGRTPDNIFPREDLPYLMQQHATQTAPSRPRPAGYSDSRGRRTSARPRVNCFALSCTGLGCLTAQDYEYVGLATQTQHGPAEELAAAPICGAMVNLRNQPLNWVFPLCVAARPPVRSNPLSNASEIYFVKKTSGLMPNDAS